MTDFTIKKTLPSSSATARAMGWLEIGNEIWATTEDKVYYSSDGGTFFSDIPMKDFNGVVLTSTPTKVFVFEQNSTVHIIVAYDTQNDIMEWQTTHFKTVALTGGVDTDVEDFVMFGGEVHFLYKGVFSGKALIRKWDGASFLTTTVRDASLISAIDFSTLCVHAGELTYIVNKSGVDGYVESFDGVVTFTNHGLVPVANKGRQTASYGGKVYMISSGGGLYEITLGAYSIVLIDALSGFTTLTTSAGMVEFDSLLYILTAAQNDAAPDDVDVYTYDGATLTAVQTIAGEQFGRLQLSDGDLVADLTPNRFYHLVDPLFTFVYNVPGYSKTNETALGADDGTITQDVDIPSATGAIEYRLLDSLEVEVATWQSSPIFTGLVPGLYIIEAKDTLGTIQNASVISILEFQENPVEQQPSRTRNVVNTPNFSRFYQIFGMTLDEFQELDGDLPPPLDNVLPAVPVTAFGFEVFDANADRIYFNTSVPITGSTFAGFSVATPAKTITAISINAGGTTGHYLTVDTIYAFGDVPTITYDGASSDIIDAEGTGLAAFTAEPIINNVLRIEFKYMVTVAAMETISLPMFSGDDSLYDFGVTFGDGSGDKAVSAYGDADRTHQYTLAGTYEITIWDQFDRVLFADSPLSIVSLSRWGVAGISDSAFLDCTNLATISATDVPTIGTSLNSSFSGCTILATVTSVGGWDVSLVTDMDRVFRNCPLFNGDVSTWTTSAMVDVLESFENCSVFNQNISGWDMSNVTAMTRTFSGCSLFNNGGVALSWVDLDAVVTFSSTFSGCAVFNQDVSTWSFAAATTINSLFFNCTVFNKPLNDWSVGGITSMNSTLRGCNAFNQTLVSWDVSAVTDMTDLFRSCTNFNQNISGWTTSALELTNGMFRSATSFDQNLGGWDVTNLTSATSMFLSVTLSTANYDALLVGWGAQVVQGGVSFNAGGSTYTETAVDSGTTDATTANKLVDSTQNFLTTVTANDIAHNTTDSTFGKATAIDSDTTLSVSNDVFPTAKNYVIQSSGAAKGRFELADTNTWTIIDGGAV